MIILILKQKQMNVTAHYAAQISPEMFHLKFQHPVFGLVVPEHQPC